MSLHKRVERLEVLAGGGANPPQRSRSMERLLHAHENARSEISGLEPLPELPYTEEYREDDRAFLEEIIPAYRASPGWQHEEGREILDRWERETRERLAKGA